MYLGMPTSPGSRHFHWTRKITQFRPEDIDKIFDENIECVYAEDVISFAKRKGLYKGEDNEFSFSDVYAPVNFGGARFCEMRVWTMFNRVAGGMDQHWDYAKGQIERPNPHVEGQPVTPANYASNRMPLWIKPDRKISVQDMFAFMRDHLEGTELDMSKDVGAVRLVYPIAGDP